MIIFKKVDDALCFTMSGKITDENYKKILIPEIEKAKEEAKGIEGLKLGVVLADDFEGVSIKAVIDDIIYGFKNRKTFHKIGISGKHYKLQDHIIKIAEKMVSGEIKIFPEKEEMFKWLNESKG